MLKDTYVYRDQISQERPPYDETSGLELEEGVGDPEWEGRGRTGRERHPDKHTARLA